MYFNDKLLVITLETYYWIIEYLLSFTNSVDHDGLLVNYI